MELKALLLPQFEAARISRFVLGAYAKQYTPEQLKAWETAFVDYVMNIYVVRLRAYSDESFEIVGVQNRKRNFFVNTNIIFQSERQPLPVQWWLRHQTDGSFKIFDLQVLGVWFAQEQRALFLTILGENNGDLDALIARVSGMEPN